MIKMWKFSLPYLWPDQAFNTLFITWHRCRKRNLWRAFVDVLVDTNGLTITALSCTTHLIFIGINNCTSSVESSIIWHTNDIKVRQVAIQTTTRLKPDDQTFVEPFLTNNNCIMLKIFSDVNQYFIIQVNIWKIIYLNCGERCKVIIAFNIL